MMLLLLLLEEHGRWTSRFIVVLVLAMEVF
jgi:hypothetical protein